MTVWGLNLVETDIGWAPITAFTWAMGMTTVLISIGPVVDLFVLTPG